MIRTVTWVSAGCKVYYCITVAGTNYVINYNNGNTGETTTVSTVIVQGESFTMSATCNNYDTTARTFCLNAIYKPF